MCIRDSLATEEDIGNATTDFDQHLLLINLQNGYYDLEQDQFYDSDPKKRFLCQFRTNYITEAKTEKWIKFLETIFEGDQERIEYIQKLVGISLTGKADFQAVIFCYGDGRNGKSTFIETLRRLFGDYFGNITSETLLSSGSYSRNTSDTTWLTYLLREWLSEMSYPEIGNSMNHSLKTYWRR